MPGEMLTLLVIGVLGYLAVKYTSMMGYVRGMSRRRMLQVGGFSIGLIWGPAVLSALAGAFSGLIAVSAADVTGIVDVTPRTLLIIGVLFVGLYAVARTRVSEAE